MRFAAGSLATAVVFFVAAGIGVLGTWALPVSAVWLLMAAIVGAVAMEERDLAAPAHRHTRSVIEQTRAEAAADPRLEVA